MRKATAGQILINESLPDDLRDYDRVLDKKGIGELLQQVAEKYPDQYRDVAKQLSDIGRRAAFSTGGYSFGLSALRQSNAARKMRLDLNRELQKIYAAPGLSKAQKEEKIIAATGKYQATLASDVLKESQADMNPLAMQTISGARGNEFNLNSLRGADLLYTDHRGRTLPIPVMRSYSMGLRPHEYFAGAFGARKGVIDLKSATQDAGFFGKQLVQAAHRLLVEANDADDPYDEAQPRGLPVETDDMDSVGALLAHPIGGYPRNTVLTAKMLKELKSEGHDEILVRSPIVGRSANGGVFARDVGIRERGQMAPIGDYVGITAGQVLAEPVTQAQISSKHSGGVAGASAGAISGFKHINQLVQVPRKFKGVAANAVIDGTVQSIDEAPQGGTFVTIGGQKHYVNRGFAVTVKPGDHIEAGDVISEGIPHPGEAVRHKGIGEGSRYFVHAFRQAMKDSNVTGNRRNIELLARGLINHVRLNEEVGDWSPDDVVPYNLVEASYRPRPGHLVTPPVQAVGRYLEQPILHYTIGTRVTNSMLDRLKRHNVRSVYSHAEPPPFEPEMIRGMANAAHDPDWMSNLVGSYQQKSLLSAVHRGAVSDESGTSYVPALAHGKNFDQSGLTQGWKDMDGNKPAP